MKMFWGMKIPPCHISLRHNGSLTILSEELIIVLLKDF